MDSVAYPIIKGIPKKDGIYFVDDEEYGELNVAHIFKDDIYDERRCRIIGWEEDLSTEIMSRMTFYGPIPAPSNSPYKLYGDENAEE